LEIVEKSVERALGYRRMLLNEEVKR